MDVVEHCPQLRNYLKEATPLTAPKEAWSEAMLIAPYDEAGDLCVAGNYEPAWTTAVNKYAVAGTWLDKLFKSSSVTLSRLASIRSAIFSSAISIVMYNTFLPSIRLAEAM